HGGFKECPNHHSHHFSSFPLLFVIPAKSQKFNGRTEPRKSASRLRLNNRTKEAEIKTSGFFF
ncbi:hypothetical protein, partial [Neisseria meningitidis]|uniref:hypothetical protein n=1 Tax=Neisseria meningitidis TaxID=487 RepID=UPI001C8F1FE3